MNAFCPVALLSLPTLTLGRVTCCGQWDKSEKDDSIDLQKSSLLPSLSLTPAYVNKPGPAPLQMRDHMEQS